MHGFNILLYGFGSKKEVLTKFIQKHCANDVVVVVDGFNPSLSFKTVLGDILSGIYLYDS